jgi:hypothetical protein
MERGILDRTHLRFFTRSSIEELFTANGFQIRQIDGINEYLDSQDGDHPIWKHYRIVSRLPNRHFHDLRYLQFAVVAEFKK